MPQELREVQTVEEKQTTVAEADSRSLTAIRERRGWVRDDNVKQSQSQKKNESKKTNCRVWSRARLSIDIAPVCESLILLEP
jgi:hypothetical protein